MTEAKPQGRRPEADRVWGGTTLDERRTMRRAVFLEAALDLIGEDGSSAVTVRSLCRRSGLSDRYFYESFESRDELLRTLYERVAIEAHEKMRAAIGPLGTDDPQEFARAALEVFVSHVIDDPRKGRLLTVEPLSDSAYRDVTMSTAAAFSKLLGSKLPKGKSGTKRAMSVIALTGSLAALLSAWMQGTLKVSRDELVEQSVELVVQTFTAAIDAGPGRG